MTSICPESVLKTWQPLFASMDSLAACWPALAPPESRLAVLDLDVLRPLIEQADSCKLLAPLLSPAERALFLQFKYPKRRLEWLGGRLAAKHCLHQLLRGHALEPPSYSDYPLLPDAHGRPRLELPQARCPALAVSISHSRGYAAALACRKGPCGIDIQQATRTLVSVRERFASEEELDLIDPLTAPLTRLGLLWSAKEAVKKCLLADHPSFFGSIRLTEVRRASDAPLWIARCGLTQGPTLSATVRIAERDGYLLACATGDADA